MARDLGDEREIRLHTDSTASKGISSRIGLGKIRHLDTALLWLQHHVNENKLCILKVLGDENVADIGTKDLEEKKMRKCMDILGFVEATGRHEKAFGLRRMDRMRCNSFWSNPQRVVSPTLGRVQRVVSPTLTQKR